MKFIDEFTLRISGLGLTATTDGKSCVISSRNGRDTRILPEPDSDWSAANIIFNKAKSKSFDVETLTCVHNNSVEVRISHLSGPVTPLNEPISLSYKKGETVTIGTSSDFYALSFFKSEAYAEYFDWRMRARLEESSIRNRYMSQFLPRFTTARYKPKGARISPTLIADARHAINNALLKVALDLEWPLEPWKRSAKVPPRIERSAPNGTLPTATYNQDAVSYYKIALSSPFPSQQFLSFYHVLEYYFLTTLESNLHEKILTQINNVSFSASRNEIDKLISTIRGQDARADETEMLRGVINKYIDEEDLIKFIKETESEFGRSPYSKKRKVFGEEVFINLQAGHVIGGTARALKHIRNAIVHSSDRYKREDCHIPLSDTEYTIRDFLPLVKYIAQKTIFGTAS